MPFYKFNSFTGRLTESTHLQPLYPISANPLDKAEPPKMIWDSIKTKVLKTSVPSSSMSTINPKILAERAKFQQNLEKPVFLLGGSKDKILFSATCVLVTLGVAQCLKLFYDMASPKKA